MAASRRSATCRRGANNYFVSLNVTVKGTVISLDGSSYAAFSHRFAARTPG